MAHAALGRWDRHRRSKEPRSSDTATTDTRFPRPARARRSFVAYAARLATTLKGASDRLSSHRNLLGATGVGCNSPSDLRRRERRPGIIERRAQYSGDELDRSALPAVQVRARPAHTAGALSLLRFAPQPQPCPQPCRVQSCRAASQPCRARNWYPALPRRQPPHSIARVLRPNRTPVTGQSDRARSDPPPEHPGFHRTAESPPLDRAPCGEAAVVDETEQRAPALVRTPPANRRAA